MENAEKRGKGCRNGKGPALEPALPVAISALAGRGTPETKPRGAGGLLRTEALSSVPYATMTISPAKMAPSGLQWGETMKSTGPAKKPGAQVRISKICHFCQGLDQGTAGAAAGVCRALPRAAKAGGTCKRRTGRPIMTAG